MPGKINLFNIGSLGVDLNTSPHHKPDGAWTQTQNGEFSRIGEEGAIKKRGASARVNSSALNGPVLAMKNMPLDTGVFGAGGGGGGSVFPFPMLFGVDPANPLAGGGLWYQSDGTTFSELGTATLPTPSIDQITSTPNQRFTIIRFGSTMYFVNRGDASNAAPTLWAYDGVTATKRIATFPTFTGKAADSTCAVAHVSVANGSIYFVLNYDEDFGVVYTYTPANGLLTQLGNAIPLSPTISMCALVSAFGTFYLAVQPGAIYRLENGAWVQEYSNATLGRHIEFSPITSGTVFAGMQAILPASAVGAIRYRLGNTDPLLAWEDVSAIATTWTDGSGADTLAGKFTRFVVFGDALYCHYRDPGPTSKMLKWQSHAVGWVLDKDLVAEYGLGDSDEPGSPLVFNGSLYIPFINGAVGGFILKRTSGGTYSRPVTGKDLQGTSGLVGVAL